MNDVLAIQLFSIDNRITLFVADESATSLPEIEYLTPFALWYAVVAIESLTRNMRLALLEIAFRIFARWHTIFSGLPAEKVRDSTVGDNCTAGRFTSFAVEGIDLIRYMNSVVFLFSGHQAR
jgi:hypothetical protein